MATILSEHDAPRVLVIYASTHGHTARIAARMAAVMREQGAEVELRAVGRAGEISASDFDAIVVGASVHGGHHQREITAWAERHHTTLELRPSAFFSVCLAAAEDTDQSRAATREHLDDFVERTGWTPRTAATFAGALQYREYDPMTRLIMRLLMHRGGHPDDITRDFDLTDWDAVERFAREFVRTSVPRIAARRR